MAPDMTGSRRQAGGWAGGWGGGGRWAGGQVGAGGPVGPPGGPVGRWRWAGGPGPQARAGSRQTKNVYYVLGAISDKHDFHLQSSTVYSKTKFHAYWAPKIKSNPQIE